MIKLRQLHLAFAHRSCFTKTAIRTGPCIRNNQQHQAQAPDPHLSLYYLLTCSQNTFPVLYHKDNHPLLHRLLELVVPVLPKPLQAPDLRSLLHIVQELPKRTHDRVLQSKPCCAVAKPDLQQVNCVRGPAHGVQAFGIMAYGRQRVWVILAQR